MNEEEVKKRKDGKLDRRARRKTMISPKKATVTREKLLYVTKERGVKVSFLSNESGVRLDSIYRLMNKKQRLMRDDDNFKKLDEILNSYLK